MSTTSTVTTLSELDILGLAKAIIKSDKAIRNKLFNTKIFKEAPLLKNNFRVTTIYLCITLFLGVSFAISQFIGFNEIIENGYHYTGPTTTITTSLIFLKKNLN